MNGKDLFIGMNHVGEKMVEEAEAEILLRPKKRPGLVFLIAAIISMLGIVAFAATVQNTTGPWFFSFFGHDTKQEAQMELTENQSTILDVALVEINQSVTQNGYTITLESGLCDGYRALIKCRVDAPAGISLNGLNYALDSIKLFDGVSEKYSAASYTGYPIEDESPNDNSITLLLDMIIQPAKGSSLSLADGSEWGFSFGGISELTGSEESLAWNTLCEGTWIFHVTFDDKLLVTESTELLGEPVKCLWSLYVRNYALPFKAKIVSFKLRSLTASIQYERPFISHYQGVFFDKPIYLVLHDGTKVLVEIKMTARRDEYDETLCQFDRPISAEDVAYIEFPGEGQVPVAKEDNP